MTYVERELSQFGFHLADEDESKVGFEQIIVLSISHLKLRFDCSCPFYPSIKALGCPLHHDGSGGSWPVETAKKIPAVIGT